MLFLEASAKTRLGIRQVFMEVVKKMLENPQSKSMKRLNTDDNVRNYDF